MKRLSTLLCLLLLPLYAYSQALTGTVRVGKDETYHSLTGNDQGLFKDLAAKGLSGNLDVLICSDLQEDGTHKLDLSASSTYTIRIRPDSAQIRTIFNGAVGKPTLHLTKKVRVVVDGRFPYRNSSDYTQAEAPEMDKRFLRFVNGTSSGSSDIPNCAIEVQYGSKGHVISSCLFQSMEQGRYGCCIRLGNDSGTSSQLRIEYCDFGNIIWQTGWADKWKPGQQVSFGIYAPSFTSTASEQVYITHNNFYNTQWGGICMVGNHSGWVISENTFQKQTALTAIPWAGVPEMGKYTYTAIWMQGRGDCRISKNRIGGTNAAPIALSAPRKATTVELHYPFVFHGIFVKPQLLGDPAEISIDSNRIGYLQITAWESKQTEQNRLIGISVQGRNAHIHHNTLQSLGLSLQLWETSDVIKSKPSEMTGILLEDLLQQGRITDNQLIDCTLQGYTFSDNNSSALLLQGIMAKCGTSSQSLTISGNLIQNLKTYYPSSTSSLHTNRKPDTVYGILLPKPDGGLPSIQATGNTINILKAAHPISTSGTAAEQLRLEPSAYGIQAYYGQLTNNRVSGMQVAGKAVGINLLGTQGSLRGNRLWNLQARQLTGFRCKSPQPHFHNSSRQQGGIGWEQTASGGQLYHNVLYIEAVADAAFPGGATTAPLTDSSGSNTIQNNLLLAPHISYSDTALEASNLLVSSASAQATLLSNQKSLLFRDWAGGDLRLRTTGNLSPCIALLDLLVDKGTYSATVPQDAEGASYAGAPDCGLTEFVHRWESPATQTDTSQIAYWPLRTLPTDAHPSSQHIRIPSGAICRWQDTPVSLRSLQVAGTLKLSGHMALTQQILPAASSMKGLWVQTGGAVDLKDYTGTLSLSQDLLVEGDWVSGAHGLQLSGKGAQLLQSAMPISVSQLTVDKEAEGTRPSVCQVQLRIEAKQLDMQRGVLDISPEKRLVILESSTGGAETALVKGWIDYRGNQSCTLPLGALRLGIGYYAPLQTEGGKPLEARFVDEAPPHRASSLADQGYWALKPSASIRCGVPPLGVGHARIWKYLPSENAWTLLATSNISQRSHGNRLQATLPAGDILFTTGSEPDPAPAWELRLEGHRENGMVKLQWTYVGLPVLGFGIEHSRDGILFLQVGEVDGQTRAFSERSSETGYYRLRIWQKDGQWAYSRPIALKDSPSLGLSLWPNPCKQGLLQLQTEEKGEILLQLCDLQGRQVAQWRTRTADGRLYWALPPLPNGCHLLILSGPQGRHCGRLIIQ